MPELRHSRGTLVPASLSVLILLTACLTAGWSEDPPRLPPALRPAEDVPPPPVPAPQAAPRLRLLPLALQDNLPTPVEPAGEFEGRHQLRRTLEQARTLIERKSFALAIPLLQKVLDSPEDATFAVKTDSTTERSIKFEALTVLDSLAQSGVNDYETQFGALAGERFRAASGSGDAEALAAVVRRYYATKAGRQALFQLGVWSLDRGQPYDAIVCFGRLAKSPAAKQFEPQLSLLRASALHMTGNPSEAGRTLAELVQRNPGLKLADDVVRVETVEAAEAWLTKRFGSSNTRGPGDWPLLGGNPMRDGQGSGGTPYLNDGWMTETLPGTLDKSEDDDAIARIFDDKVESAGQIDGQVPTQISMMQPIVVGERIIYRSFGHVRAVDSRTGRALWSAHDKDPVLRRVVEGPVGRNQSPYQMTLAGITTQRAWTDATYGTLSSDGRLVYAIEESLEPPEPRRGRGAWWMVGGSRDNRLVAYDVETGWMKWEVGTPEGDKLDPLSGAFFLGPPLPIGKRLYCLVDFEGEIRLVALNSESSTVEWMQTLMISPPATVLTGVDVFRRQSSLSPSYADGILVCPTGAGEVIAIELTTRSLLWRHRYDLIADIQDQRTAQQNLFNQTRMRMTDGVGGNPVNRWLDTQCIIADNSVIVTARDSAAVQAVDLMTGELRWRVLRGDGLYLAGVHRSKVIVVGRSSVAALQLADGSPSWPPLMDLGLPSGRGFIGGDALYVPLASAEVINIDLNQGRQQEVYKSREGTVPGNLVGTRDTVLSHGIERLNGFKQFALLEREVAKTLESNPDDVAALTLRGEIRLQRGDVANAYPDLRRALQLKPDDASLRRVLVQSLLEGLRVDFARYRGEIESLEPLLATTQDRTTYLKLLMAGLEASGDRLAVFPILLRFAEPDLAPDMLERTELTTQVRSDRLRTVRLETLLQKSSPAERESFSKILADWNSRIVQSNDSASMRRALQLLGSSNSSADPMLREVSGKLESKLVERTGAQRAWLELEQLLLNVCEQPDADPARVGDATLRLARLYIDRKRPSSARVMLDKLERDFRGTVVSEKTGAEWAAALRMELPTDPVATHVWPSGKVDVNRGAAFGPPNATRAYRLMFENSPGPAWERFSMEVAGRELAGRNAQGVTEWRVSLATGSEFQNPYNIRLYGHGHLLIVSTGSSLVAVDGLTDDLPRVLWRYNFFDNSNGQRAINTTVYSGRNGVQRIVPVDSQGNAVGSVGVLSGRHACVQIGRKLVCLDVLTGGTVWVRDQLPPLGDVFGDDEFVILAPANGAEATMLRTDNGNTEGIHELPEHLEWLAVIGRRVLRASVQETAPRIELFDGVTGKTLWSYACDLKSAVQIVGDREVFLIEPSGHWALIDLQTGQPRLEFAAGQPDAADPEPDLSDVFVMAAADKLYVIVETDPPVDPMKKLADRESVSTSSSTTSKVVQGTVYGFDRMSGKRLWSAAVAPHAIDLAQSTQLPILVFAASFRDRVPERRTQLNRYGVKILDTRTGEWLYDEKREEPLFAIETRVNTQEQQIELRLYQSTIMLKYRD